jgi:cold shock CspA family protein
MRVQGTVTNFSANKRWGWVLPDGTRKSVFIHSSDVADRLTLRENDRIEFEIEATPRGDKAVRAVLLDEGGAL